LIDFCVCTGTVGGVKGRVSKLMNSLCPKISDDYILQHVLLHYSGITYTYPKERVVVVGRWPGVWLKTHGMYGI